MFFAYFRNFTVYTYKSLNTLFSDFFKSLDQYYGDKTHQNYADYYDGIDYDVKNDDFYDDLKEEKVNDTLVIYFYRIYDQKTLYL